MFRGEMCEEQKYAGTYSIAKRVYMILFESFRQPHLHSAASEVAHGCPCMSDAGIICLLFTLCSAG